MDAVEKIIEVIRSLRDRKFTGYIKINFTRGDIVKVEKFEEIMKK